MTRMPWATASLLAIAISLAGCGDDKKAEAPAAAPAASTQSTAPAAAAKVDEAAVKAVVKNYLDIAEATYGDALTTAKALQTAVDALIAKPSEETLRPPAKPGSLPARPTRRAKPSASATRSSTTGKARLTPGRWTKA